jgi:hypothetical protein
MMSGSRTAAVKPSLPVTAALVFLGTLAWPSPSSGQGLVAPEGVLAAYLLYWTAFGLLPAAMLGSAFLVSRGEHGGRKPLAWLLATPAILYVPTSIPWVFVPDALFVGKLCAAMGFPQLHGILSFALIHSPRLRRSLHVACGVLFATLLAIPTSFWERPLVSFRAESFVDNLEGLDAQSMYHVAYTPTYWLALEDGRRLFQTANSGGGPFERPRSVGYGEIVVLEPVPSPDGQIRFELTFYNRTEPYRESMDSPEPRLRIPLARFRAQKYEARGRSYAVLLARDTEVDYAGELVTALETGGDMSSPPRGQHEAVWQSWVRTFVDLGRIDIESPRFLDRAFKSEKLQLLLALLRMGMDPDAVDSNGDTVLHVAARNDSTLFEWLFEFDVDPDRVNHRGRTPLDEARRRFADGPRAWEVQRMERVVDEWRAGRR